MPAKTNSTQHDWISLHEITIKHKDLFDYIMLNDGDITGEEEFFQQIFAELEQETTDKFNKIGVLIEALEGEAERYKRLSDRMLKNVKRSEIAINHIKARCLLFMQQTQRDRIDGIFKFSIAKNPPSVCIIEQDANLYPEQLLKTKVEISKTAIKDWLKERNLEVLSIEGKEYARIEQTVGLRIK